MPPTKPRRRPDPDTITLTLTRSEARVLERWAAIAQRVHAEGRVTIVGVPEPAKPARAAKKAAKKARGARR